MNWEQKSRSLLGLNVKKSKGLDEYWWIQNAPSINISYFCYYKTVLYLFLKLFGCILYSNGSYISIYDILIFKKAYFDLILSTILSKNYSYHRCNTDRLNVLWIDYHSVVAAYLPSMHSTWLWNSIRKNLFGSYNLLRLMCLW